MSVKPHLLAGQPLFRALDQSLLDALAACGQLRTWPAGALLLRQGERAERAWLLLEGRVALELHAPGREPLVLETLGPGELLGASWLLPSGEAQFDVRARAPLRTLELPVACLERLMESPAGHPLCRRLMAVMVRRLQAARLRLMDLYTHPGLYPPAGRCHD